MPRSATPAEGLPPEPPTQADCCRGDCGDGCVFAIHERLLEQWREAQEAPPITSKEDHPP